MSKLRLAGVIKESIVDGPGIRFVVFGQGCPIVVLDVKIPRPMILAAAMIPLRKGCWQKSGRIPC